MESLLPNDMSSDTNLLLGDRFQYRSILIDETLRQIMKSIQRFLGPPLNQIAVLVELSTLVIEAMGDFVSNYGTNRTIVHVIW